MPQAMARETHILYTTAPTMAAVVPLTNDARRKRFMPMMTLASASTIAPVPMETSNMR